MQGDCGQWAPLVPEPADELAGEMPSFGGAATIAAGATGSGRSHTNSTPWTKLIRVRVYLGMARADSTQNGHGRPHRPDRLSALPWRPHAIRAPLDTTAEASVIHAGTLRREFRRWLDEDVTEPLAEDITLTTYEAIAEIVTQADPLDAGPIRLQAHLDDDRVRVTISYTGSWNVPTDAEQSQHRLTLIHALTDYASFRREKHTITVYLITCRESPSKRGGYPSR